MGHVNGYKQFCSCSFDRVTDERAPQWIATPVRAAHRLKELSSETIKACSTVELSIHSHHPKPDPTSPKTWPERCITLWGVLKLAWSLRVLILFLYATFPVFTWINLRHDGHQVCGFSALWRCQSVQCERGLPPANCWTETLPRERVCFTAQEAGPALNVSDFCNSQAACALLISAVLYVSISNHSGVRVFKSPTAEDFLIFQDMILYQCWGVTTYM